MMSKIFGGNKKKFTIRVRYNTYKVPGVCVERTFLECERQGRDSSAILWESSMSDGGINGTGALGKMCAGRRGQVLPRQTIFFSQEHLLTYSHCMASVQMPSFGFSFSSYCMVSLLSCFPLSLLPLRKRVLTMFTWPEQTASGVVQIPQA